MLKDLRHAVRMLLHAKGWTAVVILSLALGIGANTAIFSGVNALLLTEIPVEDPDTLVRLRWGGRNDMVTNSSDYGFSNKGADGQNVRTTFSYPMYQQFLADNQTMSELMAFAPFGRVNVVVDGQAEIAHGVHFDRQLLPGARRRGASRPDDPAGGRQADRAAGGGDQLEVLAHALLDRPGRASARPSRVNNVLVTIVGVLPPEFTGVQQPVATSRRTSACRSRSIRSWITVVAATEPQRLAQPTYWWLQVMGRLKPGVDRGSRCRAISRASSRAPRAPGSTAT